MCRHPELVSGSMYSLFVLLIFWFKKMRKAYVYIMSNKNRSTLYIGVTNNLERRILEHKAGFGSAFTTKFNLTDLIYFEQFEGIKNDIEREKQLKNWHKEWKWNLIKEENPSLSDYAEDWFAEEQIENYIEERIDPETSSE